MSKSHTLADVTVTAKELLKDSTPLEIGDFTSEYQKNWQKRILGIIDKHGDYAPKYYILEIINKEYGHVNVMRCKTIVRRSRPDPDWNTDCYSYDNMTHELKLEWTLPPKEASSMILRNPERWDPFLVMSIRRFLEASQRERDAQESQPCALAQ